MTINKHNFKYKINCPECGAENKFKWEELVNEHFCQTCYYEFKTMKDGIVD